jgi:polyphosphate kinase 2
MAENVVELLCCRECEARSCGKRRGNSRLIGGDHGGNNLLEVSPATRYLRGDIQAITAGKEPTTMSKHKDDRTPSKPENPPAAEQKTLDEAEGKDGKKHKKLKGKFYDKELKRLQIELIKLQEWIKHRGLKVVVLFEGRDAAGKGGVIKRISQRMNPRICRVVALGTPTEREKTQWYFQRYAAHLPAAGEMVLFDRSWYNRAGVERVMGFCTDEEYRDFLHSCPEFERMLIRSGIILIKYWFSVSNEEQERRFHARIEDPTKRWKLSPMDLESRKRWQEYSKAKDEMMAYTDIKQSPWYVVNADSKKRARLNCIRHLLKRISYKDLTPDPIKLPRRPSDKGYVRPPITDQTFVPDYYA